MAVVIANTTTGAANPSASAGVVTMSVARASGEGLLLGIFYEHEWGAADTISSVVWDSAGDNQSFSHVLTNQADVANRYLAIYQLAAPTSAKTANITVTFSGSNNTHFGGVCRHITGHDTTTMVSGSAQRDESAPETNDLPVTVSSATGELVVAFCAIRIETTALSAGDSSDYVETNANQANRSIISGSKSGAASVTVTFGYDDASAQLNALGAVSIAPGAAATPVPPPIGGAYRVVNQSSVASAMTHHSRRFG